MIAWRLRLLQDASHRIAIVARCSSFYCIIKYFNTNALASGLMRKRMFRLTIYNIYLSTDRWQRGQGALLTTSIKEGVSLETVRDKWDVVVNMEQGDFPTTTHESTMNVVSKMSSLSEDGNTIDPNAPFDPVSWNIFNSVGHTWI